MMQLRAGDTTSLPVICYRALPLSDQAEKGQNLTQVIVIFWGEAESVS